MAEEKIFDQEEMEETGAEETAVPTAETPAAEELTLEEQLEAAKAEAAKNHDNYLRAQAELSNARKRFEKQRAQTLSLVNADLARKLLPILDDLERALETVPDDIRADGWFPGMELVYRKFQSTLESMGVQPIEAVGTPFDPNYHEALGQEPSDKYESGVVTREMLKGYQLGDRVIRPSLVYVAE